jgi:hypothetical protein
MRGGDIKEKKIEENRRGKKTRKKGRVMCKFGMQ